MKMVDTGDKDDDDEDDTVMMMRRRRRMRIMTIRCDEDRVIEITESSIDDGGDNSDENGDDKVI